MLSALFSLFSSSDEEEVFDALLEAPVDTTSSSEFLLGTLELISLRTPVFASLPLND